MPSKYRHIFFDLDHTLWDFEANSRAAITSLYSDFLRGRNVRFDLKSFFYSYQDVNYNWWQQYRAGAVTKAELRSGRFRDTLQRFGIADEELTEALSSEYISRSPYQTILFPGAIEVLEWLRDKEFQMHIITNGFEEIQHIKLREAGLAPFFQEVITSEQVDARKPDPRIFTHAFNSAGAIASESIMIGDSLEADIQGAARAGMDQAYFNPKDKRHQTKPTFEIRNLIELKDIFS